MIEFRDRFTQPKSGAQLIVHTNQKAIDDGANPIRLGTQKCCGLLKTRRCWTRWRRAASMRRSAARAATRKSRAPRSASIPFATRIGQWDPKNQRPELWNLFNSRVDKGESIRVFPLSNWTELDVWQYIHLENIPDRAAVLREGAADAGARRNADPGRAAVHALLPGEQPQMVMCRMRSLGCSPCTGAIRSEADTLPKIIEEMISFRRSERENRVIDHDQEGSMEIKKREGYF